MTELDQRVHHAVIEAIVAGTPRDTVALARATGAPVPDVEASLQNLADAHALVLHPGSGDVWVAHPFSCSPTATWVALGDRGWWAPCLWCAFGIEVLVGGRATIHARLGGEAEELAIARDSELLVHFALPPRLAWSNVIHYCSTVLPFRSEAELDAWSARHCLPRGAAVPLAQVVTLAERWYGRHRDPAWVKHTTREAQQIFDEVGLTDPFWQLRATGERF